MNKLTLIVAAAALGASTGIAAAAPAAPFIDRFLADDDAVMFTEDVAPVRSAPVAAITPADARGAFPGVRGARQAAAKGAVPLRRYVDRTQIIYALRYQDFRQP